MIATLLDAALRCVALSAIVWLCLRLPRLRNPHIQLTAWTVVLAASLLMPAATRLSAFVIPPTPVTMPTIDAVFALRLEEPSSWRLDVAVSPQAIEVGSAEPILGPTRASPVAKPEIFAAILYATVASVFLVRMAIGLLLTLRLVRAAKPLHESWAAGRDVRVSCVLSAPATFGATILLPQDYVDWSDAKLSAVLAHETAHARRGDFYVQIAAMLNRAIFWFNPLSWWLQRRLSELAEAASDDAALARVKDRPLYAEILLELSHAAPIDFGAVAMARPATVRARIERILTESSTPLEVNQRARALLVVAALPLVAVAASPLTAGSSIPMSEDEASLEQTVRARVGSDRPFYARDSSSIAEIEARTVTPSSIGSAAESAQPRNLAETNLARAASEPAAIRPTPEVESKVAQATVLTNAEPQSIEVNTPRSSSTPQFATAPRADRPVAQGAEETKGVRSGGDPALLTEDALARFVAAAPALHPGKDRDGRRPATQVADKPERPANGASGSLRGDVPPALAQVAAAEPDLCGGKFQIGDFSGQRAFLICHKHKAPNSSPSVALVKPANSWDGSWTGYWRGPWAPQADLSTVTVKDGAVVEYISSGRRAIAKATQMTATALSFDTAESRITLTRTGQNSAGAVRIDTFSGRPQGYGASSNGAIFERQ